MIQASNYLLATMNEHEGNGGLSFLTIVLLALAYISITAIVLKTFQYVKERDMKKYK